MNCVCYLLDRQKAQSELEKEQECSTNMNLPMVY